MNYAEAMQQAMPKNCNSDDDREQVAFDVDLDGVTWKATISYATLARMFTTPRPEATKREARESRQQTVSYSKEIARLIREKVRAGATKGEPIAIS